MKPVIMHVNLARGFRGGERQTELLIRHLALQQYTKQYLVCRPDSPLREHLQDVNGLHFISAKHQFSGHHQAKDVSLIHAHEAKAVHWAYLEHLCTHKPYILTRRVPQKIKNKWVNRLCYRHASMAVAISTVIRQHLQERGWTETAQIPSALAHLEVQPEQVAKLKEQYAGKFVIGHAGALVDKHKGQRIIIKAARQLQHCEYPIEFIFLGDGCDREELEQESKDLNNVHWLGFHNNLADYLEIMDLFVFPSRNEGLGSTLLDVMDHQVPIIASNVDGIPDIIEHEHTGLLIENGDEKGLTSAIIRLFEHPEEREKLTQQARKKVEYFAPEQMARRYDLLYCKILFSSHE